MKNKLLPLFFLVFLSRISFGQIPEHLRTEPGSETKIEIGTRLGISYINAFNVYLQTYKDGNPNITLMLTSTYFDRTKPGNGLLCYVKATRNFHMSEGFGILIGKSQLQKNSFQSKKYLNFHFLYNFKWGTVEFDEGCHSGSNYSDFKRFELKRNSLGFMLFQDQKNPKGNGSFYWGIGGGLHMDFRRVTAVGPYAYPTSTNANETAVSFFIRLDMGMRLAVLYLNKSKGKIKPSIFKP